MLSNPGCNPAPDANPNQVAASACAVVWSVMSTPWFRTEHLQQGPSVVAILNGYAPAQLPSSTHSLAPHLTTPRVYLSKPLPLCLLPRSDVQGPTLPTALPPLLLCLGLASLRRPLARAVAGLAGVTPASGFITLPSAMVLGLCLGLATFVGCSQWKRTGIDDALDVSVVHGLSGAVGP